MSAYIQQPDMDVHAEPIDEMARYGGLKPGMIVGPGTHMPIPEPEPVPAWSELTWRERIDSIKPGLAVAAGLCGFVTLVGFVAAWVAGLFS